MEGKSQNRSLSPEREKYNYRFKINICNWSWKKEKLNGILPIDSADCLIALKIVVGPK